jgi:hypothetical protein
MAKNIGPKARKSTAPVARSILTRIPGAFLIPLAYQQKAPPLIKDHLNLAFNDAAAIEYWGKQACNWGIATRKSKLIVVDVDTRDGKVGQDTLYKLELLHGELAETLTVQSASGGKHLYFNAAPEMLARKSAAFGRDVDAPNYVVAPGCAINGGSGKYVVIKDVPIAPAPSWFLEYLEQGDAPSIAADQVPEGEQDTDAIRERCIEYLKNDAPLAIEGRGGDATTLQVFGRLKDEGATLDMAVELAAEWWNDRCEPPWTIEDLATKARNAYTYLKENAPGSATPEADFADDPPDYKAINAYIEADEFRQFKLTRAKLKSSTAPSRGIGDNSRMMIVNLDEVKARNVDFIWPGRLARGKQTALAGEGGIGKSQITIDMMARVTNGSPWPDRKEIRAAGWPKELESAPQGYCIVLSAEDDPADTILPRLIAAGGNPKFVKFLTMVKSRDGSERKFSLQDDLIMLRDYCLKLGNVVLIVIDPASSYMGGDIDASKNTKIRAVLDPINKLAGDLQCSIVCITHFRKGTSAKAVDKVMDSVAFVNAPRVALACYIDPSDVGDFNNEGASSGRNYVLLPIKTNLPGARAVGLSYRIEEVIGGKGLTDTRNNTPIRTSRIVWQGKTELTADEVAQMESERGSPKLDDARRFLRNVLPEGVPVLIEEVESRADAEGIALDTLKRAKRALKVKSVPPEVPGGKWSWQRPTDARRDLDLSAAAEVE